jgi:transposase-like protein
LRVKICDTGHIVNKAVFIVIGVDMEGKKDILGLWIASNEGSNVLFDNLLMAHALCGKNTA